MIRLFAALLFLFSVQVGASPYDPLIDSAARRHGIDPIVMRAIVQKETGKTPWTFNCDGEGFYFNQKNQAVWALWQISKNPWMVKIVPAKGETVRQFFHTSGAAKAFLSSYLQSQINVGARPVTLRHDDKKTVNRGEARIRQLWVVNTDIGIAQVNYRFHGVSRARVQQWFEPSYNLDYAASLVAKHKQQGKSDLQAAGDYHSKTPGVRSVYMKALLPIYQREKARAITTLATN